MRLSQTSARLRPRQGSPSLRSSSPSMRTRAAATAAPLQHTQHHPSLQQQQVNSSTTWHTPLSQTMSLNSPATVRASRLAAATTEHGALLSAAGIDGKAKSVARLESCIGSARSRSCEEGDRDIATMAGDSDSGPASLPTKAPQVEQPVAVSRLPGSPSKYIASREEQPASDYQQASSGSSNVVALLPTVSNHVLHSTHFAGL